MKFLGLILSLFLSVSLSAQIYTDYVGGGHQLGVTVTSSDEAESTTANNTITNSSDEDPMYASSRFLAQATLGADFELISTVEQQGFESWMNSQFELEYQPNFQAKTWEIWEHFYPQYIQRWGYNAVVNAGDAMIPYWFYWRMAWWDNIMKSDNHLRDRVAHSLSEIFVISEKSNLQLSGPGMADYYDMLSKNAFGNFRDLLYDVTMHPTMGVYLSHMNNPKSNAAENIHPDENYAREIMQLFSIGLFELNNDGTRKIDGEGNYIPTYDNNDIKEFAKIFTGFAPAGYYWPWEDYSTLPVEWGSEFNFLVPTMNMWTPMQLFDEWHEPGQKTLLNGQVVPAGQSAQKDVEDAIDNLFNHPNVGPFIGKLLIQRMVKSNPTPSYVNRVANAFNNNGEGVRGDMKAVIKAILLDEEARDCGWIDDQYSGKMREPFLRYVQAMKAFNANNPSGRLWNWGFLFDEATTQGILNSPSVFNYFLPDYQPNGPITDADLVAPEFQIHTSATSIDYINLVYRWFMDEYYMEVSTIASDEVMNAPEYDENQLDPNDFVSLDFTDELAIGSDSEALVERINIIMAAGQLSAATKNAIVGTIEQLGDEPEYKVRSAIFLTMIAPDYNIIK